MIASSVLALMRCPLRPTFGEISAAVAAVCNRDLEGSDDRIEPAEAVIALAYKMLIDVSVEHLHAISILRYFRNVILGWEWPRPLILSLNDNRYALLVGPHDEGGYDYKAGLAVDTTKLPVPLLQASVNLAGLSSLIG